MGFNSAFKGLKLLKKTRERALNNLNNLNDPVLNVLIPNRQTKPTNKKTSKEICIKQTQQSGTIKYAGVMLHLFGYILEYN